MSEVLSSILKTTGVGINENILTNATRLRIIPTMHIIVEEVFKEIKTKGKKLTQTRKAIVEMLCGSHSLLTAPQIQQKLQELGISMNKTSVYRELEFLVKNNIAKAVVLGSGITHYESAFHSHHHHLTCTNCGNTDEIETNELEQPMTKIEAKAKEKGFVVKDHSLEFYGLCINCK